MLFGLWPRITAPSGLLALPVALWELSLDLYLLIRGFKPSPVTAGLQDAPSLGRRSAPDRV